MPIAGVNSTFCGTVGRIRYGEHVSGLSTVMSAVDKYAISPDPLATTYVAARLQTNDNFFKGNYKNNAASVFVYYWCFL